MGLPILRHPLTATSGHTIAGNTVFTFNDTHSVIINHRPTSNILETFFHTQHHHYAWDLFSILNFLPNTLLYTEVIWKNILLLEPKEWRD